MYIIQFTCKLFPVLFTNTMVSIGILACTLLVHTCNTIVFAISVCVSSEVHVHALFMATVFKY